ASGRQSEIGELQHDEGRRSASDFDDEETDQLDKPVLRLNAECQEKPQGNADGERCAGHLQADDQSIEQLRQAGDPEVEEVAHSATLARSFLSVARASAAIGRLIMM